MTLPASLAAVLTSAGARELEDPLGPADFGDPLGEHQAVLAGAAITWLDRTVIRMGGADRAKILNNLATNDVSSLAEGTGSETFLASVKGHVIGFLTVTSAADAFWLETAPGQGAKLLPHIDRYVIREQVELSDVSQEQAVLHLAGPLAEARLRELLGSAAELPERALASREVNLAGGAARLIRYELRGAKEGSLPGFRLIVPAASAGEAWQAISQTGFRPAGSAAFEAGRIRARYPEFGRDISDENLPQEVDRDALAISFKKGCYLGQETVARIDALGHVNKKLVRLRFEGNAPPPAGLELMGGDKVSGRVTSAVIVPGESPIALGYVRGVAKAGLKLESAQGPVTVW